MKRLVLVVFLISATAMAGECAFDGRYEQPGFNGGKNVAVIQNGVVIFSRHDASDRLVDLVSPHRIQDRNLAHCSFIASVQTLDDDSVWHTRIDRMPDAQTYRMEGKTLNAPGGRGLFFRSI